MILDEVGFLMKKYDGRANFDFEFAKKCNYKASAPNQNSGSPRKKLPPIKPTNKNNVANDFLDLVD